MNAGYERPSGLFHDAISEHCTRAEVAQRPTVEEREYAWRYGACHGVAGFYATIEWSNDEENAMSAAPRIPRDKTDDYSREWAERRRSFVKEQTGADLDHVGSYSFDPEILPGNVENFVGVAQIPIGIAGPIRVNGEYADGDFYVPLATTEGTLVASYSRGMRLVTECGGVKTTVVEQFMQRAPAFLFADAREAREFGAWVDENFSNIRAAAESTTSIGKLVNIQQWSVARSRYLRFNYTTGDAAGQNMVGKATLAACEWIQDNYDVPFSMCCRVRWTPTRSTRT